MLCPGQAGAVAAGGELLSTRFHIGGELGGLGDGIHQAPVDSTLATHAFHAGAENVGVVMAHMALVGHAGEAAGTGQHAQQRHFRQRHGRGAVIHQENFVASQGQLVATPCTGAIDGGQELQAVVAAGVFHTVAGFIGELAEVHFPGMGGQAQHEDVGAGAEDAIAQAGDHHGAHFGVLEANALQGIVQFDVHAQVVRVQLEFVARANAGVFIDVELQRGNFALELERPVLVLAGIGLVIDGLLAHVNVSNQEGVLC